MKRILLAVGLLALPAFSQQSASSGPLTNQRIIELVRSGVRADELARIIATAPQVDFHMTPDQEAEMMKAGVSEDTIKAMAARENGVALPQPQPAPTYGTSAPLNPQTYGNPFPQPRQPREANTGDFIEKGNKEVALAGTVIIPHIAASATTGDATGRFGYYVAHNSLIGLDFTVSASSISQFYLPGGFYRYVQHTSNPRLFPFVGAEAGAAINHFGAFTSSVFAAKGEAGIKYFVARHVSFETAYNLLYEHFSGATFKESTQSIVVFGFALTF